MSEEKHGAPARASRSPSSRRCKPEQIDNVDPDHRRGQSPGRRRESEAGQHNSGETLYVTNVAPDSRTDTLRTIFSRYGEIEECRVIKNPVTKESRGFAFISFVSAKDADEAQRALEGKEVDGRPMRIEKAKRSRPHEPTPGQYMGPTGASVKYDVKGRLKPGYMPYYALPPPKGGAAIPEEKMSYRSSRRGSESGKYQPRYGREIEPGYDRYDRGYDRYDRGHERHERRAPYERSDRYIPDDADAHYMAEPPYMPDRGAPRYETSRGPQMMGVWGYADERRGRGVDYREPRGRSRSRERYPPRGRERRSLSPVSNRGGRYGRDRTSPGGGYGGSRMLDRRR